MQVRFLDVFRSIRAQPVISWHGRADTNGVCRSFNRGFVGRPAPPSPRMSLWPQGSQNGLTTSKNKGFYCKPIGMSFRDLCLVLVYDGHTPTTPLHIPKKKHVSCFQWPLQSLQAAKIKSQLHYPAHFANQPSSWSKLPSVQPNTAKNKCCWDGCSTHFSDQMSPAEPLLSYGPNPPLPNNLSIVASVSVGHLALLANRSCPLNSGLSVDVFDVPSSNLT